MRKLCHLAPRRSLLALLLFGSVACLSACDDTVAPAGDPEQQPGLKTKAESFESDLPTSSESGKGGGANAGAKPASADASDSTSSTGSDDAQRAIVEADIIQVDGDRLYALSRVAGLTVIDMHDPAQLSILGRYRELNGTPFEMYLRDGVVLAMYSSWGQYVKQTDGNYSWVQTSKIVALDVANPALIGLVGSFDLAGDVSDSRIVGDVMYVVGYQNGSCWGCTQNKPQTTIVSLDVKDARAVHKVDELAYGDANNSYGWNKRSVTVTTERMYVAGPEYGQSMPTGSTIQVVDISNPSGDLVEGASILAAGQISSRWQMDEYQGVLRVISQPPSWWTGTGQNTQKPTVQTFKVVSSQSLTALGSTPLVIPANEQLNTVRFDGARGYAITSERRDPLFTIDLTDPAHPRQAGEVQVPGWIYHLEPRGNRLIGLGYDQGNKDGAITVSIFDVTDLSAPALIDRVNFGGDWATLPEDQDRIHKAFRILPELNLVLVPFSGWSYAKQGPYCYSAYRSGVQLVDMVGDDLTLRGAVPSRGEARRAFVHGSNLLTVSDEAVDSYDFSNRDQPATLGRLTIARNVSHALPLENQTVARINEDWYNGQNSTIDIVALADVDHPERSLGEVSLSDLLATGTGCNTYAWIDAAFARGNQINVSYQRWDYGGADANDGKQQETQVHGVLTIDANDPGKPVVLSKLEERVASDGGNYWYQFYNYYQYGYGSAQHNAVRTDNAIVFQEQRWVQSTGPVSSYELRLRIVDLTDPAHPSQTVLSMPKADGYSGLVVDGANVMLSHFDETKDERARFYVDRIDLSQPTQPKVASKVSVPGSLLHYDRSHERMLTSELVRTVVDDVTSDVCYARFSFADFEQTTDDAGMGAYVTGAPRAGGPVDDAGVPVPQQLPVGKCTGYAQKLHLVHFVDGGAARDDTYALGEDERLTSSDLGDGRVTAIVSHGYGGWYYGGVGIADCFDCGGGYYYGYGVTTRPVDLLTLGGFDTGHFSPGRLTVQNIQDPWWGFWGAPAVYAFGSRALVRGQTDAVVVDTTNPAAPTLARKVPLYGSPQDLHASGNLVLLSLGLNGVQRIDL
jgi:uncharacterized secreted protein with C-terminal beta-propeller domain